MYRNLRVGAVIPALNEERNIGVVVASLRELRGAGGAPLIDEVLVCDNGSSDATAEVAAGAGARVVAEPTPGYGRACLAALGGLGPVDIVLFVDGDRSCVIAQAVELLEAVAEGADLAIGSRVLGRMERGALSVPQRAGNYVASLMILALWRHRITDLGPFRAIRADALRRIDMRDEAYGWTVEMQVKAIRHGLRITEVPVDSIRRRHGKSKVGGTLKGIVGASVGILSTIVALRLKGKG